MKGDFSRGSFPDRKRGKEYRRVLLQQGRVLLDSDAAALVDAFDREVRDVAADLGCRAGSPDLGFLVTPGRLLALFEHVDGVVPAATVTAYRDYSRKYPNAPYDRYPSLRAVGAGNLRVRIVEPLAAGTVNLAFWCRADQTTSFTVSAGGAAATVSVTGSSAATWNRRPVTVTVPAGGASELVIVPHATEPVWIGLVETAENANDGPHFWAAPGHFHLGGMIGKRAAAGGFPDITWPVDAGFANEHPALEGRPSGDRIVAYLEVWERDITFVEDPGIREVALGGVDTTVRTQVVSQVKWVSVGVPTPDPANPSAPPRPDAATIRRAFEKVVAPTGTVIVDAPATPPSNDPCALPISGGYTGADHRLYRFEVHLGGSATGAEFKWSRDNGAELFPVIRVDGNRVTLVRGSGLADGDLVDVLSEKVEVDDQDPAAFDAANETFTPPVRKVGVLARLKQEPADEQGRDVFSLLDRNDGSPVALTAHANRYVDAATGELVDIKLRRWHGIAKATLDAGTGRNYAAIEDGIRIEVSGQFRAGSWWQYEARRGQTNDNDDWRPQPHGPERLFAPLAILVRPATPASEPMVLEAWLDHRFSPLCELDADDIAFDGDRVGSSSDTVQEALEELFLHGGDGGCCDASLAPVDGADDGQRIQDAINAPTFPAGGHLCLAPGVYNIASTIQVTRDTVIRGCPDATLLGRVAAGPIFFVDKTVRLELSQLTLYSGQQPTADELVRMDSTSRLVATEVGFLAESRNDTENTGVAIRVGASQPLVPDNNAVGDPAVNPEAPPAPGNVPLEVVLDRCVVIARHGVVGGAIDLLGIDGCAFVVGRGAVSASSARLAIAGSSFVSGLDRGFFANTDATVLRAAADELLLTASRLTHDGGWGLSIEWVLGGYVERSQFSMDIGIWARVALDLRLERNTYVALPVPASPANTSWGLRLNHVRRVLVDRESISSEQCIEVPLSARNLEVRGCTLYSRHIGIVLASDPWTAVSTGVFLDVSIEGNSLTSDQYGISIGHSSSPIQNAEFRIVRNTIYASLTALDARCGNNSRLTISDNEIGGPDLTAIVIAGANNNRCGVEILRNRITGEDCISTQFTFITKVVDNELSIGSSTGINASNAGELVVIDNQVRSAFGSGDSGTNIIQASQVGRATVTGNIAEGDVNIAVISNGYVRVSDNTTRKLTVTGGTRGIVHGNIILETATIPAAGASWIVTDNLVANLLAIAGSLADVARFDWSSVLDVVTPMPTPGPRPAPELVLDDVELTTTTEREAWTELMAPVRDFTIAHPDVVLVRRAELPTTLRIAGNIAGAIEVGSQAGTPRAPVSPNSSVHIEGNQVEGEIRVRDYQRLVVANNSASSLVTVTPTQTRVLGPNLDTKP